MLKAVILDFDDTLCPTEAAGFAFENEILKRMGRPPQERKLHQQAWGQPMFEAIKLRSPGVDVAQFHALASELWPLWVSEGKMDAVPQENLQVLDMLRYAGFFVCIVTSRMEDEVRHMLHKDHPLTGRIHALYYHEVLTHHKPDPRTFDVVLQTHALRPEECVYIGDSPGDAAAATQAGMQFIACLENGIRTVADFAQWPLDAVLSHFRDLPSCVAQLAVRPNDLSVQNGQHVALTLE